MFFSGGSDRTAFLSYCGHSNATCVCTVLGVLCLVTQSCPTLYDPMGYSSPSSSGHGNSSDKNTGVGYHALLQGIFPIAGSNPVLLHCRWILYWLNHQGSPRILEWVSYPFFRGPSPPRNWTMSPALQADSLPAECVKIHKTVNSMWYFKNI